MRFHALFFVVVACVGLSPQRAAFGQCQYEVTVLPEIECGFLSGPPEPTALNNLGHVVGYYNCGPGFRAALWTGGSQWITLPLPPAFDESRPYAINDLDEVVGEAVDTVPLSGGGTSSTRYACLWRPGQPPQLLGIPAGGNYSIARGINNHSEICGYWGNSNTGKPALRAFLWRTGGMQDLQLPIGPNSVAYDINDLTEITGWMGDFVSTETSCYLWRTTGVVNYGTVPGGFTGEGVAIGENGLVSGGGRVVADGYKSGQRLAARWQPGHSIVTNLLPLSQHMFARGGNDFATVGYADCPNEIGDRGFLYQAGSLYDLTDLNPTAVVTVAQDVNREGQIVARGRSGKDNINIVLTPIRNSDADVSRDCKVDIDDLLAIVRAWDAPGGIADIDKNGTVGIGDLLLVIEQWSP